jgi:hypothetical protein
MFNYIFLGEVHPKRTGFNLGSVVKQHLFFPDFSIDIEIQVIFAYSEITITFSSDVDYSTNKDGSLETLKNKIEDAVRIIVDTYGFVKSFSYDVEIIKAICPQLNLNHFFSVQGEYNIIKDTIKTGQEFNNILSLFSKSEATPLKDAMADFRRSIKYPSMTAGFCLRAIETVRKSFFEDFTLSDEKKRRKDGWRKLNEVLGYQEKDYEEINKFAVLNRHGDYPTISYDERERIMNFTREILERLILELQNPASLAKPSSP